MVRLRSVALLQRNLEEQLEELGGTITNTTERWDWVDFEYTQVYWEVQAYFDEDDYDAELEEDLEDIVDGTSWELGLGWDISDDHDEHGIILTRDIRE